MAAQVTLTHKGATAGCRSVGDPPSTGNANGHDSSLLRWTQSASPHYS